MNGESLAQPRRIKETPVLLVFLFIILTAGIYIPIWFLRRRQALNSLDAPEKLKAGVFVIVIILYSASLLLLFFTADEGGVLGRLIDLVATIVIIVQCFAVRRILDCHFNVVLEQNVYFSGILTFFLGILYLQYMINRLRYHKEESWENVSLGPTALPAGVTSSP